MIKIICLGICLICFVIQIILFIREIMNHKRFKKELELEIKRFENVKDREENEMNEDDWV